MSNHTDIIILSASTELEKYCNQFLKEQYTIEKGWTNCPSFQRHTMPFSPDILVGQFNYFHMNEFCVHLEKWFHHQPTYEIIDNSEKPTKTISQAFRQTNRHGGQIQLLIRSEHEFAFFLIKIDENSIHNLDYLTVLNQHSL